MDNYKINRLIGEGSYSTVYSAIDTRTNKTVAIKSIVKDNVFVNEIRVMKIFQEDIQDEKEDISDNVVHPLDIIEDEHNIYLVFELCKYDLISFVNEHTFDEINLVRIIRQVLLGLHYIHSKHIIHRDIKMSNVLVADDQIKICDFGLSCFVSEPINGCCGTLDYLAPEIRSVGKFDSKNVTEKIDIYAVGVIFKILISRCSNNAFSLCKNDHFTKDTELDKNSILHDFLLGLLEESPDDRLSAEKALSHSIFTQLFPECFSFNILSNFSKAAKYGNVEKKDQIVMIDVDIPFDKRKKRFSLSVESPCICSAHIKSLFAVKINGIIQKPYLLSTFYLKYYNYLLSYLFLLAKNSLLTKITEGKYSFKYFLGNNYIYSDNLISLEKPTASENLYYFINLKNGYKEKSCGFPLKLTSLRILIDQLVEKSLNSAISKYCNCYRRNEVVSLLDFDNNISELSLKTDNFLPCYVFIDNLGWMIKEKHICTFLISNGHRFSIDIFANIIKIDEKQFFLSETIPDDTFFEIKNDLIIARRFFKKILQQII